MEWPEISYNRLKMVSSLLLYRAAFCITTNGQYSFQSATPCTDHIVKHVKTFYAQRFSCIEGTVWIWCFESCKVKQSFVNNSNTVSHFLSLLFANGKACLLFRPYAGGHI